jgi:hypothetical protein
VNVSSPKEKWLWLAPLLALIAIVAGVAALLWGVDRPGETSAAPAAPERSGIARPAIRPSSVGTRLDQAPWRIRTFPVGWDSEFDREARKRWRSQRSRVGTVVRRVYNRLFLGPRGRRNALTADFVSGSGRALLASRAGLPRGATRVQTVRRTARIGLMAMRPTRAAAEVVIRVKARTERRRLRMRHRSSLWLERDGRGWNVIAFELSQKPTARA